MENLEKVEKLREKTGVTYEDAKMALEACNYDMLDAIIYLEKLGKVVSPQMSSYTTTPANMPSQEFAQAQTTYEKDCKGTSFGEMFRKFCRWFGEMVRKGCECGNVSPSGTAVLPARREKGTGMSNKTAKAVARILCGLLAFLFVFSAVRYLV